MLKKFSFLVEGERLLIILLLLGCVEFGVIMITSLGNESDPKNAILFGYSLSRLALAVTALIFAGGLLTVAISGSLRAKFLRRLDAMVEYAPNAAGWAVIFLAGLAAMIGLAPAEIMGRWSQYFLRARVFLFFFLLIPAQLSIYWVRGKQWYQDRELYRSFLAALGVIITLGGFIIFSGWGITPDGDHWNPVGSPLTSLQLITTVWIGVVLMGLWGLLKNKPVLKSEKYFDGILILGLFVWAWFSWANAPSLQSEFNLKPAAPYFQPFPSSDAALYDVSSISILNGSGISFGQSIDKPLYLIFLAFLHLVGGFDYNLLTILHSGVMALMIPGLYLLGKSFHSRLFGFILAGIILFRQINAISLSNLLYFNANPRQFLTEVPTMGALIFFTWSLFAWQKAKKWQSWRAFVTGGILGAATLLRLNPILLIPSVPAIMFLWGARQKKAWLTQTLLFLLGCTIVIAPWALTTRSKAGIPFLWLRFYNIINSRYGPSGALPQNERIAAFPQREAEDLQPLRAGFDLPPFSIRTFPGFIINNGLHNFVGAFLTLPDSIQASEQNLKILANRPYWAEGREIIAPAQIPFLLINVIFLALGLGWAWKRWKMAGLAPLFVFTIYAISLGISRTSGSRYLVPIDWVFIFYFGLGLISSFLMLPAALRRMLQADHDEHLNENPMSAKAPKLMWIGAVVLFLMTGGLVPAAQNLIPPQAPICQPGNLSGLAPDLLKQGAPQQFRLVYGKVLYPTVEEDELTFTLLTCERSLSYTIDGFNEKFEAGQLVLAGLRGNNQNPSLVLVALPPEEKNPAKLIWKGQ